MSILNWFTYRSPKQRKKDSERYLKWAFPYGERQREIVVSLLGELIKDEPRLTMASYLIARQEVIGDWEEVLEGNSSCSEEGLIKGSIALKNTLQKNWERDAALYLAVIEADFNAGEELNYPDAETLRNRALEIKELIRKKKK